MKKLFGILLIVAMIFSFCSKEKKSAEQVMFMQDSTLVAIVNGEKITSTTVDDAAKQMLAQSRMINEISFKDSLVPQRSLEWLVAHTLLKQEVVNRTFEVKDKEIDTAIDQIRSNFPSDQVFQEALQRDGSSLRQLRENLIVNIKIQKLLEQEVAPGGLEVSTEEAKKYYDENSSQFQKNNKVRARHILLRVPKTASEAVDEQARQKAELILSRIKGGEDFTKLAGEFSEDPASKTKGGDLGFFAQGDMVKAFDEVAFSLQVGEISDLVRTEFGYHIIKVEDIKSSEPIPFDTVQDRIKGYLKQVKSDDAIQDYIEKLKQKAKINFREN